MSTMTTQYQVLSDSKFATLCALLDVTEQCCFDPDKKLIEKAFRKKALSCHPDKGGDTVVFKKLNDAYNKLIGHIEKLDQQSESVELANSILIEISKTSVSKWQEKLKTRYGWFKSNDCKNIIFDGPYKQYMGRSSNTGNITVVLYEDPPDTVPKLHVRSSKYMAWIAEQMLPVHMHAQKGKILQFDQWRIAHLGEFGICNFSTSTPATPAPEKKKPNKPKTRKAKRREEREASERRAKANRESEPNTDPPNEKKDQENVEKNKDPINSDSNSRGKYNSMDVDEGELPKNNQGLHNTPYNCGQCKKSFNNRMDYSLHNKICIPNEDLEIPSEIIDKGNNELKKEDITVKSKKSEEQCVTEINVEDYEYKLNASQDIDYKKESTCTTINKENDHEPKFECEKCDDKFTNMVWYTKHINNCQVNENRDQFCNSDYKTDNKNQKRRTTEPESNILPQINSHKDLAEKNSQLKHSKISFAVKDRETENNEMLETESVANKNKPMFESPTVENLNTNTECNEKKKAEFENNPKSNDYTNKLPTDQANTSQTTTGEFGSPAQSVECGKCDEMLKSPVLHTTHIHSLHSETIEKYTAKDPDIESASEKDVTKYAKELVVTEQTDTREEKSIVPTGNESDHNKTDSHGQILNHEIKKLGSNNKITPKIQSLQTENGKKVLTKDFVDSEGSTETVEGDKSRLELNINKENNTANKKKNTTMKNIADKGPNIQKLSTDVSQEPRTKLNVSQTQSTKANQDVSPEPCTKLDKSHPRSTKANQDVSQEPCTKLDKRHPWSTKANPDVSKSLVPSTKPAPTKRPRSSLVYVVGHNTFAGNPNCVRTIKHSVSSSAVSQQCKVK